MMEATHLGGGRWAVRPKGALGTCGWGKDGPWQTIYVTASSAQEAIRKAMK